jgi:hypothetical protein
MPVLEMFEEVPNIFPFPFEKVIGNRLVMRFASLFSANLYYPAFFNRDNFFARKEYFIPLSPCSNFNAGQLFYPGYVFMEVSEILLSG